MDVAISVCLDIALIAVIAVFVAIGVRKGFLRSIIGIVGCIVAVIVAVSFSSGVGEKINDKFVHEPVRKWVVNQLTPDPGNVESSENEINFDGLFEEQPSFFTDFCGYVNVGVDKLKEVYDNYVAESVESAREHVIDAMATPLASSLSRYCVCGSVCRNLDSDRSYLACSFVYSARSRYQKVRQTRRRPARICKRSFDCAYPCGCCERGVSVYYERQISCGKGRYIQQNGCL